MIIYFAAACLASIALLVLGYGMGLSDRSINRNDMKILEAKYKRLEAINKIMAQKPLFLEKECPSCEDKKQAK